MNDNNYHNKNNEEIPSFENFINYFSSFPDYMRNSIFDTIHSNRVSVSNIISSNHIYISVDH